ncbi:MAG: 2-oxo acid dehydrogenase subunit E2 [Deltaproteobacteria bacterium]|nr:MAG: 2-oxo acid dehydrogenase subunit E2 [Deltaproteobacteria bacterium]
MAVEISIPKIGVNVTEVRLVEWKAKEGDWIEKGGIVLVIETEKTVWEVEAKASGFLHILLKAGAKAQIEEVVGLLTETEKELNEYQKETPLKVTLGKSEPENAHLTETASPDSPKIGQAVMKKGESIHISPLARKMAKENLIDITHITGTGPGGRIVKKDIERALIVKESGEPTPGAYQGRNIKETIPLKGMRQSIAEHMHRSLSTSAQMTVMGELDMGEIVRVRDRFIKREESLGLRISYVDMMVYIISRTLKAHPSINCSLIDNEIMIWEDINIGVAVALGEEGLIVPVIKNADQKSLIEISREIKELTKKAQEKKLIPDEVTGGTFTLSTVGRQGQSRFQTPILNEPEAAILGAGPIEERAVVRDGQIVIRPIMPYSLTFDHRAINGFGAEQFMGKIREFVESPHLLMFY